MYEELIKRMRKYSDDYSEYAGERHKLLNEGADAIEKLAAAVELRDGLIEWLRICVNFLPRGTKMGEMQLPEIEETP